MCEETNRTGCNCNGCLKCNKTKDSFGSKMPKFATTEEVDAFMEKKLGRKLKITDDYRW